MNRLETRLILDVIYGVRTVEEIRLLLWPRACLATAYNRVNAFKRWCGGKRPQDISAHAYILDPRNRTWRDTPAAFFWNERNLTPKEDQ